MNPTDDELLAALLDVLPGEDWVRDPDWHAENWIREVVEAPTREAMIRALKEGHVGGDESRVRLADELCRRFPQPITVAVLEECGFRFYGDMCGAGLFSCEWNDDVGAIHDDATTVVSWGERGVRGREHREEVRDARRLRELVEGLKVVYGRKE